MIFSLPHSVQLQSMLLSVLLITLTCCLNVAQANWPCIGFKCPPSKANATGKQCNTKDALECDNPDCDRIDDPACKRGPTQFKCDVGKKKCEDYVVPSSVLVGAACTNNRNCSAALVCVNKQCVTGRAGSFKDCVTNSDCSNFKGEECEDGVCLLPTSSSKYTDPSVPSTFNPDPKMAKGPCDKISGCPTADLAQLDLKLTLNHQKNRKGRKKGAHADTVFRDDGIMMPPGPEFAGCRDAKLEDGTSDCPDNKDLCKDKLYQMLMEEQCPMTCGLCGVSRTQSRRRASNRRRGKRDIINNVVNGYHHIKP
uniref:ShKT domain-containing protein n=1 Tax=Ditylenchus dipsaci TaxID=166011 RepID=A0A915E7Q1_9BILA